MFRNLLEVGIEANAQVRILFLDLFEELSSIHGVKIKTFMSWYLTNAEESRLASDWERIEVGWRLTRLKRLFGQLSADDMNKLI